MDEFITVHRSWLTDYLTARLLQNGFSHPEALQMATEQMAEGERLASLAQNKSKKAEKPNLGTAPAPKLQSQAGPEADPVPARQAEARAAEAKAVEADNPKPQAKKK